MSPSLSRLLPLALLGGALGVAACKKDKDADTGPTAGAGAACAWEAAGVLDGTLGRALARLGDGDLLAAGDAGLQRSTDGGLTWGAVSTSGLPEGPITFLGAAGAEAQVLAWVHGKGLVRSVDGGVTWASPTRLPSQPLLGQLNPRAEIVPTASALDADGRLWLAGIGGVFFSDDGGDTFSSAPISSTGSLNVLFQGIAVEGEQVLAVSQLADSILPSAYEGLLSGVAFYSDDGGASWDLLDDGLDITAPTGAAFLDGVPCLAAIDGGVRCYREGAWQDLGGPPDAVGLAAFGGGLSAGSASQGAWRLEGETWTALGAGPLAALDPGGEHALGQDGQALRLVAGAAGLAPPEEAGGTVHIALSFHVNLYHSYRGDTSDEDGYGKDIRVMRTVLDWLEARPGVHADWDIENQFSLDGWLASDAPDIIERIGARVDAGQDDVRLMSWNNGAMATSSEEEFRAAVRRAQDSYAAVFSSQVPGVQPQECMFTPDHIGWYRDEGVDWITLFYAANGFTAMREDVRLEGGDLYNPVTLRDPQTLDTLTWVPAYHHADVLEHGGLSAWARQIRRTTPDDTLLLVHFDADGESWENFYKELDRLQAQLDAGEVVFTTIQDYLDGHSPVTTVDFLADVADGTGDGFQSWAEKDFNQRLMAAILDARERAAQARALGDGDAGVEALLAEALTPRLISLSTTHFGLAAPYLADQRVASAWGYADAARDAAQDALDAALALDPPAPGEVRILNHRDSTGTALVETILSVPAGLWSGTGAIAIYDEGGDEIPVLVGTPAEVEAGTWQVPVSFVVPLAAGEAVVYTWRADAPGGRVTGSLSPHAAAALSVPALIAPLTECDGVAWSEDLSISDAVEVDARAVQGILGETGPVGLCEAEGTLTRQRIVYDGLPGVVLAVEAALPEVSRPEDAESVALSPLVCPGTAETIRWRTFGGTVRERPMRAGVETWNGQSADGWLGVDCTDGSTVQIAHRVVERSAMGMAPLREQDGVAMVAPLGTLWGDGPWHDGRRTGGTGLADVSTAIIGSQFRPAAPDWAGQTVTYRLLLGTGEVDEGTLDLFAHPPLTRVGAAPVFRAAR